MHALNSSSRQAEAGESEVEATLVYRASSKDQKKKQHEEDKKRVEVSNSKVIYYYTHYKS